MQMTCAEPAVETVATAMAPAGGAQVVSVTGKHRRASAGTLPHAWPRFQPETRSRAHLLTQHKLFMSSLAAELVSSIN